MKSSIPHIVLTGSSGFLGQYVLHSLVHYPLSILQQPKPPGLVIHALYGGKVEEFPQAVQAMVQEASNNVQVQVHKVDLTNDTDVQTWLDQFGSKVDVCIHTAAISNPGACQADPEKARALNIPKTFLKGLAQHKVTVIGLSTDHVYDGTQKAGQAYKETDQVNPINMYGQTKVELEEFLLNDNNSNNNILLRSSIISGPKAPILGEKAHATFLHFCQTQENQETTFYTDEIRSIVAVDNVVQVVRWFSSQLLQEQKIGGVYNMGGPDRVSRYDMAQAVFEYFGYTQDKLIATEKSSMPPQAVQSPLDIAMNSSKLYELTKDSINWKGVKDIVKWTFEGDATCSAATK